MVASLNNCSRGVGRHANRRRNVIVTNQGIGQLGRSAQCSLADKELGDAIVRTHRSGAKKTSVVAAKDRRCGESVELEGRELSINTLPHFSWHSKRKSWGTAVLDRGE